MKQHVKVYSMYVLDISSKTHIVIEIQSEDSQCLPLEVDVWSCRLILLGTKSNLIEIHSIRIRWDSLSMVYSVETFLEQLLPPFVFAYK